MAGKTVALKDNVCLAGVPMMNGASTLEGYTPALIGVAIGIYGLTQAALQIPFGMASDRFGRKPVITLGLLIFAIGSVVAASADTMMGVILGRALQGAGAIAAAVMALTADLTREEKRLTAMAIIGMSIGVAFAVSLVVLTVYIFLQDLRTTLIPAITIPVSLIGTFAVMMLFGMSINTLTLFGLVLAIGIVVDDAIVVVENTKRIIDEEGLTRKQAATKAMQRAMKVLKEEGTTRAIVTEMTNFGDFNDLIGFPEVRAFEAKYRINRKEATNG